MSNLSVSLFGKLQIRLAGTPLESPPPKKARELLVYLLLHRRSHPREKLATLLWQRGTTERTKAYLRKALWQLRQSVEPDDAEVGPTLLVDGDWIRIHPEADLWVDVAVFEDAFDEVRDCTASEMSTDQVEALEEATSLYTGDLLENWYQEWCLKERERLKDVLLRMLDRLTRCCEQRGSYDSGIQYGLRALRIDPARERIHRHLMRLRARAGDRTGALRQYEHCADVLDRELGVSPATATRRLHEKILTDTFPTVSTGDAPTSKQRTDASETDEGDTSTPLHSVDANALRDDLDRIRELQNTLDTVQKRIRDKIEAVEIALQQRQ